MKLDKTEISVITATVIIVAITIITSIVTSRNTENYKPLEIYVNSTEEKELLANTRTLSKKYDAYEDLYKSDKLTLVYSYYTDETDNYRDEDFHKNLTKKLTDNNITINTVTYKNWKDDSLEVSLKNKQYIDDSATCGLESSEESTLKKYIENSQECIKNVCLVDVKKNKFWIMSSDADYIIETIKKYPNIRG